MILNAGIMGSDYIVVFFRWVSGAQSWSQANSDFFELESIVYKFIDSSRAMHNSNLR